MTQLLTFALGYIAVLAVPGPNLLALSGLAMLQGLRAAVPMCLGVAIGAMSLAGLIDLASVAASTLPWNKFTELLGAVLLLIVAGFVLRLRPETESRPRGPTPVAQFGAGFCTALTNPITSAYFAAEFSGELRGAPVVATAALVTVPVLAFATCLALSSVLATLAVQRALQTFHLPIRLGTAAVLATMAGLMAARVM